MSDGTLRALAWLVALFQPAVRGGGLVGLEEPETALHPGSVAVLFDALRSATRRTQVLVTSHSAELLEHPSLRPEELLAVQSVGGRTLLAPIPASSAQAMRSQSFTAGELLKLGALSPEPTGGTPRGREIFGRGRGER
jgi:predicted ATPase